MAAAVDQGRCEGVDGRLPGEPAGFDDHEAQLVVRNLDRHLGGSKRRRAERIDGKASGVVMGAGVCPR